MTRKDFRLIAAALHDAKPIFAAFMDEDTYKAKYATWEGCVAQMSDALATTNPNYRPSVFWNACQSGV